MPSLIFVLIAPILSSSFSLSVLVQLVLWNYIRKCKTTLKIVKIICVCSYITDLAPRVRHFYLYQCKFPLTGVVVLNTNNTCLSTILHIPYHYLYPCIKKDQFSLVFLAPRVRLERTTYRLTAECSTIELPRIMVALLFSKCNYQCSYIITNATTIVNNNFNNFQKIFVLFCG